MNGGVDENGPPLRPEQIETLVFSLHHDMLRRFRNTASLPVYRVCGVSEHGRELSALFRHAGIRAISLRPAQDAGALTDGWLNTGRFDAARARGIYRAAASVDRELRPATAAAVARGLLDPDQSNEPPCLIAVRSAWMLTGMLLDWHADGRLADDGWRAHLRDKAARLSELIAENGDDPGNDAPAARRRLHHH